MEIVIATKNKNKVKEIQEIFSDIKDISFISLADYHDAPEIEETGTTFADNALIKARGIAAFTGRPSLADDSGLEVDALGGRPGVYSARYGGPGLDDEGRCLKIIEEMSGIHTGRSAGFVCVIALVFPDGREFTAAGRVEGEISEGMHGSAGFGYDPLFYIPSLKKTFAELTPEEKNRISHRGSALEKMRVIIASL